MAVSGAMDAARRRFVFGVNAIVQGVLAIILIVGVVWLAGRFKAEADLTRTRVNSLSERTRQLLRGLDQDVRITAVFAEPDKRDELGLKRRRQVRDLLDLYDAAGGARVSTYLLDPSLEKGETDRMLARLKLLPAYQDEARPHEEALAKFPALNEKVRATAESELVALEGLLKGDARLAQDRNLSIVRLNLQTMEQESPRILEDIQELLKGELPRYGRAVQQARDYLTKVRDAFTWVSSEVVNLPGLTPELRTFFQEAAARYAGMLAEMAALLDATKELKDVKLEELYNGLTRWRTGPPLLVEGEKEARLLSFWEIWPPPSDPNAPLGPDGDDREFAGEAALSSAILQLTHREKTAVIFTRYGGPSPIRPDFSQMNPMMMRQLPRAPYQALTELLEKAGFTAEDWDVQQAKTPPPAAEATRRIYVVLPPEPPPRPNPMEPSPQPGLTPEDRQLITGTIQQAGMAVFLTGWMPPAMPFPGATGTYEFGEYLKTTWGVEVQHSYMTLEFTPSPERPGLWVPASREPWLITTDEVMRFTDHAIGKPLQAERAAFYQAAPLKILGEKERPAGVDVQVVAEVQASDDVWACNDLRRLEEEGQRNRGFRRADADLAPPFPVAVAATDQAGHKLVVFSSVQFAADAVAQAKGLLEVGNSLVLGLAHPGNSDLFINGLHWLTGDANRIAVGPRRGELPRLKDLDAEWAGRLPWFLVGVWPATALVVGVGVWLVRRR